MLLEKNKDEVKENKKLINEGWCPTCNKKVVLNESKCPNCGKAGLKKILNG